MLRKWFININLKYTVSVLSEIIRLPLISKTLAYSLYILKDADQTTGQLRKSLVSAFQLSTHAVLESLNLT